MRRFGDADSERVRAKARSLIDEYHLPGLSVGVVQGGDLVYAEGLGHADIESGRPQDPALRQCIGSITKTMTGLCVMALAEEGRLSLDDRVVELLPDVALPGHAGTLTVRHLLSHTGGIGEAPTVADLRDLETATSSPERDRTRAPACFPAGITVEVQPGTKFAYANHGFALLGELLMRLEGVDSVDDVFRRRIFGPLGMNNSDCRDEPHPGLSTGYHRPPDEDTKELLARVGRAPADESAVDGHNIRGRYAYFKGEPRLAQGGVQSTIYDMARYAAALLRRGGGIVRPETFDAMLTPHWQPDARLAGLGLTFFLERRFGRQTFGHGGSVSGGWNTRMTIVLEEDLALLVHANVTFDKIEEVDGRLLQAMLDAPARSVRELPLDPGLRASAPGVYEAPTPGPLTNLRIITTTGRVQVTEEDGGLVFRARRGRWKHGARLLPCDPNDPSFLVLDADDVEPHHVALVRHSDGRVSGLRLVALAARDMVRNDSIARWA